MNDPKKSLEEIKASLNSAEVELSKLNEKSPSSVDESFKNYTPIKELDSDVSKKKGWGCMSMLVLVSVSIVSLQFIGTLTSKKIKTNDNNEFNSETRRPLSFSRSCGSRATQGSNKWWPVLGAADPDLLREVKTKYCGDAYITADNALQVASFDSREAAYEFAKRIEQVTNRRFRVGQGK